MSNNSLIEVFVKLALERKKNRNLRKLLKVERAKVKELDAKLTQLLLSNFRG